jgi:hypothetical protein
MERIKTYEEFNEELNWKQLLTGAALTTSLILSPIKGTATTLETPTKTEFVQIQNTNTLFTKKTTVSGTKDEVLTKVVGHLRKNGGHVNVLSKEKLTASFTLTDVKPDGSEGFTNIGVDISINGNEVEFNFKKADFFYSGMQPKTATQQMGQNLKVSGIDALSNLTQRTVKNPVLGNRLASEIQKTKHGVYKQPENFKWEDAVGSNKNVHKSFINSLNKKIATIVFIQ